MTSDVRLLILADLHLGARLTAWGRHAPARRAELRRSWQEAVELVLSPGEGVDGLLVAGDLFDRPVPDVEEREAVVSGIDRLVASGKVAVLLPGLYDGVYTPKSIYLERPWAAGATVVDWTRPRRIELRAGEETLVLHTFAPHPTSEELRFTEEVHEARSGVYRVGLFHAPALDTPLASWTPGLDADALAELGLDLVVVGGDHRPRQEIWGRTVMITPGSPVGLGPDEVGPRSWVLVNLTPSGINFDKRDRDLLPVVSVGLDLDREGARNPDAIAERLRDEHPEAGMVVLRLSGLRAAALHLEDWTGAFDTLPFPVRLCCIPVTAGEESSVSGGLRGAFAQVCEERANEEGADRNLLQRALGYGLGHFELEAAHVD